MLYRRQRENAQQRYNHEVQRAVSPFLLITLFPLLSSLPHSLSRLLLLSLSLSLYLSTQCPVEMHVYNRIMNRSIEQLN